MGTGAAVSEALLINKAVNPQIHVTEKMLPAILKYAQTIETNTNTIGFPSFSYSRFKRQTI